LHISKQIMCAKFRENWTENCRRSSDLKQFDDIQTDIETSVAYIYTIWLQAAVQLTRQ